MRRLTLSRKSRITLGIITVAGLTSASIFATAPSATPEEITEKAWPITAISVTTAERGPTFGAYGRFVASDTAVLTSKVSAYVDRVLVREGDEVEAGQLLVQLDDSDIDRRVRELRAAQEMAQAELDSIRGELRLAQRTKEDFAAMYASAQSKLQRHKELLAKRLISQTLFDEVASSAADESIRYLTQERRLNDLPNQVRRASAEYDRAAIALEQAEADLDATQVKAPFTGPILAVTAAAGQMSNVTTPLVEMAARSSFELRLQIPEVYAARLQQCLANNIVVTAHTDTGHQFVLRRLGRQVKNGQSGVDGFFVSTDNAPTAIPIGQITQASVALPAEADVIALPVQSLYENDRVYRIVDNRLDAIIVERIGEAGNGREHRVLVRAQELMDGTPILATQLPQATSGLLVTTVNTEG